MFPRNPDSWRGWPFFFVAKRPIRVGTLPLPAGEYFFGYTRDQASLLVNFYEAATGKPLGQVRATLNPATS